MPPSDTFFSQPGHWGWLIVLYFFFGGIAGGSFFLGALLDVMSERTEGRHEPMARLAYQLSMLALLPCPPLLILDLDRPERFWHLFVMSERLGPMFKWWSPMSVGSWALLAFGAVATVMFLAVRGEASSPRPALLARLRPLRRGWPRLILAIVGGLLGFFVAGYTGVLLSVTNRPIWADTPLLGLLFLLSAASSSAAALTLLARRQRAPARESLQWLARVETRTGLLELAALVALVISLGPVARVWLGGWGVLLVVGVVLLGIVVPAVLASGHRRFGPSAAATASVLVLIGGLLLRTVIVLSSEGV